MRLTGPLVMLSLLIPATALAASSDVNISDDQFDTPVVQIQPGDSVTWHWTGSDDHSVTASPNQTERFGSKIMSSGSFSHTFAKPGRFTYFCRVHSSMHGVVEVGPAPFPDTGLPRLTGARASVSGSAAKLAFALSEKARVRVAVTGPSKRIVTKLLPRASAASSSATSGRAATACRCERPTWPETGAPPSS